MYALRHCDLKARLRFFSSSTTTVPGACFRPRPGANNTCLHKCRVIGLRLSRSLSDSPFTPMHWLITSVLFHAIGRTMRNCELIWSMKKRLGYPFPATGIHGLRNLSLMPWVRVQVTAGAPSQAFPSQADISARICRRV